MNLLQLVLGLLPASSLKNRLLSLTSASWQVDPTARIGPTVFWRVRSLSIGRGTQVGALNCFRQLRRLEMGDDVHMGSLNWCSGEAAALAPDEPTAGHFVLGDSVGITSRHLLDCSGGLIVGAFATFGGSRTQVLTHGPDLEGVVIYCRPVRIGAYSVVLTSCVILTGVTIGDRVVVGAGAVVNKDLLEPQSLYGGVPAVKLKDVGELAIFTRTSGRFLSPERRAELQRLERQR